MSGRLSSSLLGAQAGDGEINQGGVSGVFRTASILWPGRDFLHPGLLFHAECVAWSCGEIEIWMENPSQSHEASPLGWLLLAPKLGATNVLAPNEGLHFQRMRELCVCRG